MEELNWYKFTENNDNEGEAWHFFVQLTSQEWNHIQYLIEEDESYYLDDNIESENEINVLVKHSDSGYMSTYNKVGRPYVDVLKMTDTDDFYKGRAWLG